MNTDDAKLTAYALGELSAAERAALEAQIAGSKEAQDYVNEIGRLSATLKHAYKAGGEQEPRSSNLIDIREDRWFWSIARPLAIAATLAVIGLVAAILFGGRHLRFAGPRSSTTEIELVDSTPRGKPIPESVPNPLQVELIGNIDHVAVGELDESAGEDMMRVLDDIRDPVRVTKLKRRLTTSRLQNIPSNGKGVRSFRLIFLDRLERTIAYADFSCGGAGGAVLRLVPPKANSARPRPGNWQPQVDYSGYAIPLPDWKEAIGRCPDAG